MANGIVHLISKPLVVIANPLIDYLKQEEENNGRLAKFSRYLRKHGGKGQKMQSRSPEHVDNNFVVMAGLLYEFIEKFESTEGQGGTLFVPSNDAFDMFSEKEIEDILEDEERALTILGLHFIDQRIASDDVRILQPQNKEKVAPYLSITPRIKL